MSMAISGVASGVISITPKAVNEVSNGSKNKAEEAYKLGLKYVEQDMILDACMKFTDALKFDPTHIDARYALAKQYIKLGGMDSRAMTEFSIVLKLAHEDGTGRYSSIKLFCEAHYELGMLYLRKGWDSAAMNEFISVARLDPNHEFAQYAQAKIFMARGQDHEAEIKFNEVLRIKPKCAYACHDLGIVLKRQGKIEEAITKFNEAVIIDPKFTLPHVNLFVIYCEQGKTDKARLEKTAALRLNHNLAAEYLRNILAAEHKDGFLYQ
jgi:Tfp pilus assembly protein PilF